MNSKFQIKQLVAATYRIDNSGDAERSLDISANVHITGETVQSLESGRVTVPGSDNLLADFSDYGTLNSNIYDNEHGLTRSEVFNAISDFCDEMRAQTIAVPTAAAE